MADEVKNVPVAESKENAEAVAAPNNKFEPQQYVTFDVSDIKNRVKIFNAHNSAVSFKTLEDKPINVVDVMTEIGVRSQSGNKCQNTYLFTDDNVYFTQSNGIGKTVNELVDMVAGDFKANTTNGFVTVQLAETELSGDRTYKQLKLIAA